MEVRSTLEIMKETITPDSFGYIENSEVQECMKKYAAQFIELAAEQAEIDYEFSNPYDAESIYYVVDRESILKLKNQIQ